MSQSDAGSWPPTDRDQWGAAGTTGGVHGSFLKRYLRPLALVARRAVGVTAAEAEELAVAFVGEQVEREARGAAPVFDAWDPQRGRFRDYLFVSFRNYCRRSLARDAAARLDGELSADEVAAASEDLGRWVAREHLNHARALLRERIERAVRPSRRERLLCYLAERWPERLEVEPPTEAQIALRLGLTRSQVERDRRELLAQIPFALAAQVHREGLSDRQARLTLEQCRRYLALEG